MQHAVGAFQIISATQAGRQHGMRTLIESLLSLVEKKIVAPEEAYVKATDKEALSKALAAASFR